MEEKEEGSSLGMLIVIIMVSLLIITIVVGGIIMKKKGINPFIICKCKCRRCFKDGVSTVGNVDDKNKSKETHKLMSTRVIM